MTIETKSRGWMISCLSFSPSRLASRSLFDGSADFFYPFYYDSCGSCCYNSGCCDGSCYSIEDSYCYSIASVVMAVDGYSCWMRGSCYSSNYNCYYDSDGSCCSMGDGCCNGNCCSVGDGCCSIGDGCCYLIGAGCCSIGDGCYCYSVGGDLRHRESSLEFSLEFSYSATLSVEERFVS